MEISSFTLTKTASNHINVSSWKKRASFGKKNTKESKIKMGTGPLDMR